MDAAGLASAAGAVVVRATGKLAARVFSDVALVYASSESVLRTRCDLISNA